MAFGIAFGIGILPGYFIGKTKAKSCISSEQSIITTTLSSEPTLSYSNSSTTPRASPSSTTATEANITITATTTPTMTTTSTARPPAGPCPPALPEPTQSVTLLSLNETATLSNYKRFSLEYLAPIDVTTAMLMFEFQTVWGSWYLDDVSIKELNGDGSELIDNGGFEIGSLGSNWKYCHRLYSWLEATVVTGSVHSGGYSYSSRDDSAGSNDILTQIINVKGNTRYNIEIYLFVSGEPTSATVTLHSH